MRGRWRGDDDAGTTARGRRREGTETTAANVGVDDAGTAARRRRCGDDEAGTMRCREWRGVDLGWKT